MTDYPVTPEVKDMMFAQSYEPLPQVDGVQMFDTKRFVADEGDFAEVMRLDDQGGLVVKPDFKLRQVNRTHLFAGSIKAWHFHFQQDEMWYISPTQQITVGVWDIRKDSPTAGVKQKIVIGGNRAKILFIPRGVAHGSVNFMNQPVELFYFVNNTFSMDAPDEFRLHWDAAGADFWNPERD